MKVANYHIKCKLQAESDLLNLSHSEECHMQIISWNLNSDFAKKLIAHLDLANRNTVEGVMCRSLDELTLVVQKLCSDLSEHN